MKASETKTGSASQDANCFFLKMILETNRSTCGLSKTAEMLMKTSFLRDHSVELLSANLDKESASTFCFPGKWLHGSQNCLHDTPEPNVLGDLFNYITGSECPLISLMCVTAVRLSDCN